MSSNGHQESQKHPEKFGVLLRRMTLAGLGLDDLEGVGAESMDALASADRFCDRIDQRSQGLGGGSRVEVLSGLPRFMQNIQGRYLPMADNGVLSRVDLDGPRTPADLGPWRRLLDATLLVLFDEDEDGDFVPWSPQVRRRDVGRAIAEMARERQLPAVARVAPPSRAVGVQPERKMVPLAKATASASPDNISVAERFVRHITEPIRQGDGLLDVLSLSEETKHAVFGRSTSAESRRSLTASSVAQASEPLGSLGAAESNAGQGWRGAGSLSATRTSWATGLPGVASVEAERFSSSLVQRNDGQSTGLGSSLAMLGSLRSVRPLGGEMLGAESLRGIARFGEGTQAQDLRPIGFRAIADAEGAAWYNTDLAPGSLLALVPENVEAQYLALLAGSTASTGGAVSAYGNDIAPAAPRRVVSQAAALNQQGAASGSVSAYPKSMGRAGAISEWMFRQPSQLAAVAQGLVGKGQSVRGTDVAPMGLAQRGAAETGAVRRAEGSGSTHAGSNTARIRERLVGFATHHGRSGALLQSLADEMTHLAGRLTSTRSPGVSASLLRDGAVPSSLGFRGGDILASLSGVLARSQSGSALGVDTSPVRYDSRGVFEAGVFEFLKGESDSIREDEAQARAEQIVRERMGRADGFMTVLGRVEALQKRERELGPLVALLRQAAEASHGAQETRTPRFGAVTEESLGFERSERGLGAALRALKVISPGHLQGGPGGDHLAFTSQPSVGLISSVRDVNEDPIFGQLGRLGAASEARFGRAGAPSLLSDTVISGRHMPALAGILSEVQRFGSRALFGQGELLGTAAEESTLTRLNRMLSLIRVGDKETAEVRETLRVLQRAGMLPAESRLAWVGDEPVLLHGGVEVPPMAFGDIVESGLSPAMLGQVRQAMPMVSAREMVSPEVTRGAQPEIGDVGRMWGFERAIAHLAPEILRTGDWQTVQLLKAAVGNHLAELGSNISDREVSGQRGSRLRRDLELGRVRRFESRPTQVGQAEPQSLGQQWETRRIPSTIGIEREMVGLSLVTPSAAERRSQLSADGDVSDSVVSRGDVARSATVGPRTALGLAPRRQGYSPAEVASVKLDVERKPAAVFSDHVPRVSGLSRHEERVAAQVGVFERDVSSWSEGFGVLGVGEQAAPVRVFSDAGDRVQLSYSPRVLQRIASQWGTTPEAERQSASLPARQLQATLREALTRPGSTLASVARELSSRIVGLNISSDEVVGAQVTTRSEVSSMVRAIERAVDRFGSSTASSAKRVAPYFGSILPTAFDSASPARILASAFRGLSTPAIEGDSMVGLRHEGSAGQPGRRAAGAHETVRGRESQRRADGAQFGGKANYEMVRPSSLSRVLSRFSPEIQGMYASPAWHTQPGALLQPKLGASSAHEASSYQAPSPYEQRFSTLRGEPGQLSDALEHFRPASSSPAPEARSQSERRVASVPQQGAQPSLAESLWTMKEATPGTTLIGEMGEQILSRVSDQGETLGYVTPVGLTNDVVADLFDLGSGRRAQKSGDRHEEARMLSRIEHLLDKAQKISGRTGTIGVSAELAALARLGETVGVLGDQGLPAWRKTKEHVAGVELGELRDMLRQVGAMPVQGDRVAADREYVNPFIGRSSAQDGAEPLFKGDVAAQEAKPSSEVQNQQQAFAATDAGVPPWEELALIADEVYRRIIMKLRDELNRRRSE